MIYNSHLNDYVLQTDRHIQMTMYGSFATKKVVIIKISCVINLLMIFCLLFVKLSFNVRTQRTGNYLNSTTKNQLNKTSF